MKISIKMNLLSGFLLSGFLFLLAFSVFSLNTIIISMNRINIVYSHLDKIRQCENLLVSQLAESQQIILRDKGSVDGDLLISLRLKNSQLNNEITELEKSVLPDSAGDNSGLTEKFRQMYTSIDDNLIQRIFNREDFDTAAASERIFSDYGALQAEIRTYQDEINKGLERAVESNRRTQRIQIIIFSVLLALMSISILAMIIFMRKSVLGPVRETSREMLNLSEGKGNLEFRFNTDRDDEIGEMGLRFNGFIEKTSVLVSRISEAGRLSEVLGIRLEEDIQLNSSLSENLKNSIKKFMDYFNNLSSAISGIETITDKIFSLSHRSKEIVTEQETILFAASESIIETVEEIKLLRSNGRNSLDASEALMSSAADGSVIINELDRQIEDILASAKNLLMINEVIGDISDRTKILGVNAAIEAARAGSSGNGFKIVASEIAALGEEVRSNAARTEDTLNSVLSSIAMLKDRSGNGKGRFDLIRDNSAELRNGISLIMDKLKKHEKHEKKLVENISELSESSKNVSRFILELDGGITDIFNSIKSLDEDLHSVNNQVAVADRNAGELNEMRRRLEQTAGENHSVAETLNNYIEHFQPGIY